jgi:pyruvate,water dikinase
MAFAVTAEGYRHFLRSTGLEARIQRDSQYARHWGHGQSAASRERGAPRHSGHAHAARSGGRNARRVCAAQRCSNNAARCRRAQQRHGGGFAGCELRRPAGDLSECAGRCLALLEHCRRSFASLFTDRAISYRVDKGFDHSLIALVHRRAAHGALGPRLGGRHVHHRHRDRLPRRRAHQRRLRSR